MPDSSQPDGHSSWERHPDNDLANLTRVVIEHVLVSFTKPLNVVPLSLHLVKMLEHFPANANPKHVEQKETQS